MKYFNIVQKERCKMDGEEEDINNGDVVAQDSSEGESDLEYHSDDELILLDWNGWLLLNREIAEQEQDEQSSSDDNEEGTRIGFDSSLPTTHSYLGEGMEELHGRTIHDAADIVKLPLMLLPGVTLVPNQILPLHLFHPQSVSMMKRVLQADKTFGVLNYHRQLSENWPTSHASRHVPATVGTTAEIFSVKEEEEYGVTNLTIKAEGRQRFKVRKINRQVDGVLMGEVQILEDAQLPEIPADCLFCNYKKKPNYLTSALARKQWTTTNYRFGSGLKISADPFPRNCSKTAQTSLSAFPHWVYQQYNPYKLMDHIMDEMREWNKNLETKLIPTDPNDFSHWLTHNLPFDDVIRISLLELDCPIVRLRKQLDFMRKCSKLQCRECASHIADKSDLFSMSQKGPVAAYVNPGGYVHETVTFYKARGLRLRGSPSCENSWFPGYAWTIAECRVCSHHMGWKFTACNKELSPSKFWGLTRALLTPKISE